MPALISPYKGTADTVVDPGPTQTIVEVFQGDEAVTDPHATGDGGSDITSQKEMQDYRLKELLRESAKKMMKTKWSVGSDGKEFHFFLSHKKQHSRDGSVHAQIAANMSDALTNLNFTPFLDIDTLTEITTQGIRDACMKSCSMVVLLNNETKDSEWCNLEWKIAEELRLPVLVIVDMERASKAEEITHFSQMYPTFMRFQWVEYTGMRRREALEEITTFLTEQTLKGGDDETNSQVSTDDIADSHVYHHGINTLMAWGGLDLVPKHKRSTISTTLSAWYVSVKFSTYVCLGVCITRLIYAHGPAFTDYNSALATVAVHLHLIWAPIVIRSIMLSVRVRKVLSEVLKGADVASIYFISKWLFYAGALLVPVALLLYVLAWEPLFFSMMYIGPQASMFEKVFGIGSGVLFLMGIFTHIPLLVCVHIMSIIIKLMSCVALTSATDKLHPQLANLGLERYILLRRRMFKFKDAAKTNTPYTAVSTLADTNPEEAQVAAGSVPPLSLTDVSIAAFQEHWQTGWRIYVSLNSNLWPMHNIQLLWTVIGLSVPSSLAIISHLNPDFQIDIPETPLYIYVLNCLRVVWIWAQGPVFLLIEVAAEAFITFKVRKTKTYINELVYAKASNHEIINNIAQVSSSSRFSSLRIPCNIRTVLATIVLFLASAIPWFFVRFSKDCDRFVFESCNDAVQATGL